MAQDTNKVESSAETELIRAQIEETRAGMTETIDAIQERLSPARLMTQAKDTVVDATLGRLKNLPHVAGRAAGNVAVQTADARATIMRVVRTNPIPAALLAVAVSAVVVRAFRRGRL